MKQLHSGDVLHGFTLKSISDLPEYKGKGYAFKHNETGMDVFHLYNDDIDNLFSFAFKTPVSDDTGVAHILEHSVLSGSRKYPVKDPFMSLIKGSMNTFINAMTYPDKTVYPASSPVEKDYFNIMGVYADAVFFPLLKKEVFWQEGHRLEFDENGKLRIVGVVYNEMKGAYSNHDSIAAEWSVRSLFSDNQYHFNSGGEPGVIPDLAYETFIEFHASYYHPSNCRLFLYGNIPSGKQLKFLQDGFLKAFTRKDINPEIKIQKRWKKKRLYTVTSALSEGESPEGKSTILINYLTGDVSDPGQMLADEVMSDILLGNVGAPLYKAIVESGLGSDVSPVSGLEQDVRESVFSVGIRGSDPDKRDAFEQLVYGELEKLVSEGIPDDIVTGALKRIEFRNREIRGGAPAGLRLMDKALRGWLHGYKPEATLAFADVMKQLKADVSADKRFFETRIENVLLKNNHRSVVTVYPDRDHTKKQEEAERERINAVLASLTDEKRKQIETENRLLKVFQETPESPEALASIPSLSLEDLPSDISTINTVCRLENGLPVYMHDIYTNGIVYVDFSFNTESLDETENRYLPLLGKMLTSSALPGIPYHEVARLFTLHTGGFYSFLESSSVIGERTRIRNSIFFRLKFLEEDLKNAADLAIKMFLESRIDEKARLKDVIMELREDFSSSLIPAGNSYATLRAGSAISPVFNFEEKWRGLDQYLFLADLSSDMTDTALRETGSMLLKLREKIFTRHNVKINITAPEKEGERVFPVLQSKLEQLHAPLIRDKKLEHTCRPAEKVESVYIPAPIGFVGCAFKGSRLEEEGHAAEILLSHILKTEFLWNVIRMKGGAYGASASANGMEGIFIFSSYRDPKVAETMHAYKEGLLSLSEHPVDTAVVTQAVIAVVGKDVRPLSPGEKSIIGFRRALYGIQDELRRIKRQRLLSAGPEDIQKAAKRLLEYFDKAAFVILSGKETIEKAAEKVPELPGTVLNIPL